MFIFSAWRRCWDCPSPAGESSSSAVKYLLQLLWDTSQRCGKWMVKYEFLELHLNVPKSIFRPSRWTVNVHQYCSWRRSDRKRAKWRRRTIKRPCPDSVDDWPLKWIITSSLVTCGLRATQRWVRLYLSFYHYKTNGVLSIDPYRFE